MLDRSRFAALVHAFVFSALLSARGNALNAAAPVPGPREVIPFDTGWRFHLGDDAAAKQPAFDDASWRTLDVPHDWSIELPVNPPPEGEANGGFFAHGVGWYRKHFMLPATTAGKKVVVEFDRVHMNSDVWINGQFLGRRPYGFIGFRYDLTDLLKTDGTPNVLAVRVDDSLEPSVRRYAGAGICRHVQLIATSYTHFRLEGGIGITTPEIAADHAIVESSAIIDAHFFLGRGATVVAQGHAPRPAHDAARLRAAAATLVGPHAGTLSHAHVARARRSHAR